MTQLESEIRGLIKDAVRQEIERAFQERVGRTRGEMAEYEAELVAAHQNALKRVRELEEGERMLKAHVETWKSRAEGYAKERDRVVLELAQERWKVIKLEEEVDRINSPPIAPGSSEENLSSQVIPTQQTYSEEMTEKSYVEWLQGEKEREAQIVQPGGWGAD